VCACVRGACVRVSQNGFIVAVNLETFWSSGYHGLTRRWEIKRKKIELIILNNRTNEAEGLGEFGVQTDTWG